MCGHNLIHILITSLTLVSLVSSELYHIVPTDSPSLCVNYTADSCMSLAQFAGRYVTSNDSSLTLVFSPGEHTLSQIIHISNIHNVTLIGDSEQLTVINYVGDSGFELVNIWSILYVAYLNMSRDGQTVLAIDSVTSVLIRRCQIVARSDPQVIQLTAVVVHSALSVSISKTDFQNNQILYVPGASPPSDLIGTALVVYNSNSVLVEESSFANNFLRGLNPYLMCGVICLLEIETVTIINCAMKNNTVLCHGCQSQAALGGAIYLHHGKQLTVINSTFEKTELHTDRSCFGAGGAIHAGNVSMTRISGSVFSNNSASYGGSIYIAGPSHTLHSSNNIYTGNTARLYGGAILSFPHAVIIDNDHYEGNTAFFAGTAVAAQVFTLTSVNSSYIENAKISTFFPENGGALRVVIFESCNITKNKFIGNSASFNGTGGRGGAMQAVLTANCIYHSSSNMFINNSASLLGGAVDILVNGSNASYNSLHDEFTSNVADLGGAISIMISGGNAIEGGSFNSLHNKFIDNTARFGGAIHVIDTNGTFLSFQSVIVNNIFLNNRAGDGGAFSVFQGGNINIVNTYISNNREDFEDNNKSSNAFSVYYAKINVTNCTVSHTAGLNIYETQFFGSNLRFHRNSGPFRSQNSALEFDGECEFIDNIDADYGGAIWATRSNVQFKHTATVKIHGNRAINGGGIFLLESQLNISCPVNITGNTATQSGGGIYAYRSDISLTHDKNTTTIDNNIAQMNGGGAALVSSTLNIYKGTMVFHNNTALQDGGAVYLEQRSIIFIYLAPYYRIPLLVSTRPAMIKVLNNSAQNGGGVFVDDDTSGHTLCEHVSTYVSQMPECFLQALRGPFTGSHSQQVHVFFFVKNMAQKKGNDIYGGMLDRCTADPNANLFRNIHGLHYMETIATFNNRSNLTNDELAQHITSGPVQVCFCNDNKTIDCAMRHKNVSVRRGGTFRLMVTAVDQVLNQVTGTIISAFSNNTNTGHFNEGQTKRSINNSCTELEYNVYSDRPEVLIDLYADGPCGDEGLSKRTLSVTFLPCTCPIGFQSSEANQNCTCSCDAEIKTIANCSGGVITLLSHDWVGFVNESTNNTGLLVYPCPFDYCLERPVNISLSVPNGADMQCAFNRSNLLCGECKQGLSLVLGSSKCMKCTDKHLALLLPFAILGILLVALILVLNMTVAVGTINGLIFYANIVGAAQSVFFSDKEVLPLKIFIAWLNLDFGIETCFYNGMTSTAKVLLQLVFPSYLILLTVVIIVLCECSQKFAALLGKRNPVATLCTLILLSYSKLLRMIIASLQFTHLSYPDHSSHIVWLYDANVPYFEPSHSVPLFLVSSIIIILGAVYTVLLFFGQWLPRLANRKMMKWIRHPKYNAFIDAYHAPFSPKHRYWVGLLLLARIVHDVVQALTADRSVTLLTTACVALTLVMLKMMNVHTHKNWTIDTLESFFLVQLVVLSLGTYHVILGESHGSQMALVTTSTSVSILIFVAIICYHFYKYVLHNTRVWMAVLRVTFTRRQYRDYQLVAAVDNNSSDEEAVEHASIREEPQNYTEDAHTASKVGIDKCYVSV